MMSVEMNNPIAVAALTGGQKTASARFRFRQYIDRLKNYSVQVQEHIPYWGVSCGLPSPFKMISRIPGLLRSRRADVVWINKELVQGYMTFEKLLKRPRILDVDDAIWKNRPFGRMAQPAIARAMDAVIAGNEYLASYYRQYCPQVFVVPTAIDLDRYPLRPADQEPKDRFIIGWTGQRANYPHLFMLEGVLGRFLEKHSEARVRILSNSPWRPERINPDRVENIQWTPDNEISELYKMHVGIMPLKDDEWARGKCSFKMLQYMAAGLPVIASPVGMNQEVLAAGEIGFSAVEEEQWIEALEALYGDSSLRSRLGAEGRRVVEQHYNADQVARQLAEIFHALAQQ